LCGFFLIGSARRNLRAWLIDVAKQSSIVAVRTKYPRSVYSALTLPVE
jgi:hypothetical protein